MDLKEKVVVITGSSDGLGKETALRLAKEGAKLALISRNEEELKKVAESTKELGAPEAKAYKCDIRETDRLKEVAGEIVREFGGVDILINNAGIWQRLMPLEEIPEEEIDAVIETNLSAMIHLTNILMPELKKSKEAAILNVVSKSGVEAKTNQSVYNASKYGARGFTENLILDLEGSNIRVAGLYQGGTNTKMFEKVGNHPPKIDQFTDPKDLADVVAYMLSQPEKIWLYEIRVSY